MTGVAQLGLINSNGDDGSTAGVLKNILQELRAYRQERERTLLLGNTLLLDAPGPTTSPRPMQDALSPRQVSSEAALSPRVPKKANIVPSTNRSVPLSTVSMHGDDKATARARSGKRKDRPMNMPVQVGIAMQIRRIMDLDTVEQTFTVIINITMQWEAPPGESPPAPGEDDGDWQPDWTPKLRLRSTLEQKEPKLMYFTKELDDGRQIVISEGHHIMKISEQLELGNFPNDVQDLPLMFVSLLPTDTCVWTRIDGTPLVSLAADRCVLNDFQLLHECPFTLDLFTEKLEGKEVSALTITVKVARRAQYYIINVAFTMFLIASMVLVAWSLHPGHVAARFDVDFSLLLTAVAFKFVLINMLPPISYLTTLDIYILSCFLFLTAATVSHMAVPLGYFRKAAVSPLLQPPVAEDEEDWAKEDPIVAADMNCFWTLLVFWIVWNTAFWCYFYYRKNLIYQRFLEHSLKKKDEIAIEVENLNDTVE